MSGIPDYALGTTLNFKFTTRAGDPPVPTTLLGTPVVRLYRDGSAVQLGDTGDPFMTLSTNFDGLTGFHNLQIVATAANGLTAGSTYSCVFTQGTVGGAAVAGETIQQFSLDMTWRPAAQVPASPAAGTYDDTFRQTLDGTQKVADVSGDVLGRVLGAGAGTITGVGVWADGRNGDETAKDSTVAKEATGGPGPWTTAAGFSTHSAADVWTSATRQLTAAQNFNNTGQTTPQPSDLQTWRGGVPDNLLAGRVVANAQIVSDKTNYVLDATQTFNNTGQTTPVVSNVTQWGGIAASAMVENVGGARYTVQALSQAPGGGSSGSPRAVPAGPTIMEIPQSGTTTYRFYVYVYDITGGSSNADSTPTITVQTQTGVDRSANFSGTVQNQATGVYFQDYDVASTHAEEGLRYEWTVVETGTTIVVPWVSVVQAEFGAALTRQDVRESMLLAPIGAPAAGSVDTKLDTIQGQTDQLVFTGGNVNAQAQVVIDKNDYRLSVTGRNDILRSVLNQNYAAAGAAFTLEQALYMLWSAITENGIAGSTLTARQLNGTTPAMTWALTLDGSNNATNRTRAT